MRSALIIGISGQDGSYLLDHLTKLGYRIVGTYRKEESRPYGVPLECIGKCALVQLDINTASVEEISRKLDIAVPDEIYNLAGQTYQPESWVQPSYTMNVNGTFVMRLMEAMDKRCPKARLFQASSASMFGHADGACNESTPLDPMTPYDVSKAAAHKLCQIYRDQYGLFISTGIMFSHESPRRGKTFVSRKISSIVALWASGVSLYKLSLGGTDFAKDWGYAPDFVEAMHKMLQLEKPDDYVLGSGKLATVQDFIDASIESAGVPKEVMERNLVIENQFRRQHAFAGYADSSKAQKDLGWNPDKTSLAEIADKMVKRDIERLKNVQEG